MGKSRVTTYKGNQFQSTTGVDESTEERTKEKLQTFRAPERKTEKPAATKPEPPVNAIATPVPPENTTTPRGKIPEWMRRKQ